MKLRTTQSIVSLLAFLFLIVTSQAQFWSENFETDGEGTRYTTSVSFNDGTSDHFNRTDGSDISNVGGAYSAYNGTYFWAGEDLDD
ncbi:MAG: hypothetical protein KDC12_14120, partial [Flavobacteriales bacterium]|nr:hypothetical protein [Flavobacteriales bacterium]